jgi:transposase
MIIPQPTSEGSVLVAIDISKARNDVLIEVPGKTRRIRLTVLNSRSEHDRFLERLTGFDRPVIIGFEATGNYHRPLAYRLIADSDEVAHRFRFEAARDSDFISPIIPR